MQTLLNPLSREQPNVNSPFIAACIQNCAGADLQTNVDDCTALIREAAKQGARLICTPEFFACFDVNDEGMNTGASPENNHPALKQFKNLAGELQVTLVLGSLAIEDTVGKLFNRCYVIDASGEIIARYSKLHMFDVDLAGGESYRESDTFTAGGEAVIAQTEFGDLGLSICYDLRFAYLYRALCQAGANYLSIPAAFMKKTGQAHWHVLLRSRAIETGSYVFAPCQYGKHGKARTYGHSLIIDPWGEVLADGGEERGFILADVDPAKVTEARRMIPALRHDRVYKDPISSGLNPLKRTA